MYRPFIVFFCSGSSPCRGAQRYSAGHAPRPSTYIVCCLRLLSGQISGTTIEVLAPGYDCIKIQEAEDANAQGWPFICRKLLPDAMAAALSATCQILCPLTLLPQP